MLREEITPTLETLRADRSAYLEFQKTRTEIDHLSRFVTAHMLYEAEVSVEPCCWNA